MSDSIVIEESNGEIIVIEPTVVINQATCAAEWGGITGDITDQADLVEEFALKVDKVDGKELSTNDYTTDEKNKLAGIDAGAQVNVIPTWNSVTDKPETFLPAAHTHSGMVTSPTIATIVTLTQTAYDALNPKVTTTLYIITGA